MTRVALWALGGMLFSACAGHPHKAEAPVLSRAKPQALTQLVEAAESARAESGKEHAIQLLQAAARTDPSLWEAHYDLGILLADKGDLRAAERELSDAAKLAPNAEDVALALSEVRRRSGDDGGGIAALAGFVKQNPEARVASVALITALREGGRVKEAIEQAQRVLARHASDPYALSELALANVDLGELDAAELLIEEALKADDKSAVAERSAGLISLRKGDDAVAFKHFQRASELDPKDTTARLNTGTVLLQAGVYDRAAQEFRAVLQIEPASTDAMLALAAARRGQGKREDPSGYLEAEKLLLAILDREPKNLDAEFNLGILYSDYLKRPSEATPLLRRFLDDAPQNHPGRPEAERLLSGVQSAKK